MKKYVFLAFILIFGTSILSNYITYKSTNSKNESTENFNSQNIVENVDSTFQNIPFEEQEISKTETETDNGITANIQTQESNSKKTPVEEKTPEVKENKNSTPQVAYTQKQTIAEVKQEDTKIKENNNNTPQTKDESIQTNPETTKQEVIYEQPVTIGEEYKVNDTMINTIKSVITNNQSEDMKLYGYNIVVDNSIIDITSQFTYTEQRVIDKIKYKFGTIRIYARDYYNNGQYICTQCYII